MVAPKREKGEARFNLIGPRLLFQKFKVLAYVRGSNSTAELLRLMADEVARAEAKGEVPKHLRLPTGA